MYGTQRSQLEFLSQQELSIGFQYIGTLDEESPVAVGAPNLSKDEVKKGEEARGRKEKKKEKERGRQLPRTDTMEGRQEGSPR